MTWVDSNIRDIDFDVELRDEILDEDPLATVAEPQGMYDLFVYLWRGDLYVYHSNHVIGWRPLESNIHIFNEHTRRQLSDIRWVHRIKSKPTIDGGHYSGEE